MTNHDTTIREARDYRDALTSGDVITVQIKSTAKPLVPVDPDKLSGMLEALLAVIEQQQDEIAARETGCRCTIETGCGEGRDAGCEWCANADIYDPCPVFGFMCDPECGNPEEPCCTEWQQANTRAFEQRATEIGKLRDERQALRAKVERQAETLRQVRERANDYADAGLARILDADGGDA